MIPTSIVVYVFLRENTRFYFRHWKRCSVGYCSHREVSATRCFSIISLVVSRGTWTLGIVPSRAVKVFRRTPKSERGWWPCNRQTVVFVAACRSCLQDLSEIGGTFLNCWWKWIRRTSGWTRRTSTGTITMKRPPSKRITRSPLPDAKLSAPAIRFRR